MKTCPGCGKEYPEEIRHCPVCGAQMFAPASRPCPNCESQNLLGTRYCKGCGIPLMPSVKSPGNEQPTINSQPQNSAASSDPAIPEWVTRFEAPTQPPETIYSPHKQELINQLHILLAEILDVEREEITAVQVHTRGQELVDLVPAEPVQEEKQELAQAG